MVMNLPGVVPKPPKEAFHELPDETFWLYSHIAERKNWCPKSVWLNRKIAEKRHSGLKLKKPKLIGK